MRRQYTLKQLDTPRTSADSRLYTVSQTRMAPNRAHTSKATNIPKLLLLNKLLVTYIIPSALVVHSTRLSTVGDSPHRLSRGRGPCVEHSARWSHLLAVAPDIQETAKDNIVWTELSRCSSGRVWHFIYCHLRCSHVLSVFFPFFFFVRCPSSHRHCAILISSNKYK